MAQRLYAHHRSIFTGHIPHQGLAGQVLLAVDQHGVGAADTVGTAFPQGQAAVDEILNK